MAYDSDRHAVTRLVREAVARHRSVLSDPEPPDTALRGFGDSGVNRAVEFWSKGLDGGKNKFIADILLVIWDTLKGNNISIPFPLREVRVLGKTPKLAIRRKKPDEA